ncbi:Ig-like domain-containing protein [Kitasatospora sp. NPDC093550]|uniref:Ig-like domain-containing protein n=1 Tax=Kitasatospora sp. NPDC093550 TaxID=3364089 RepID=UPI00382FAC7C
MSRQFPRTAAALAVLTAGLLTGWNVPLAVAQQTPDTWSGEHRAVLPSGLSVQLDFEASPGVRVTAGTGELADRAGGGRSAALYTDGIRPGDPAQTFELTPDRPQADGSWRTAGTLRLTFSRPVRNPRLHLSGLATVATGKSGTTGTATRLTLTGGSPTAPVLVHRTDFPGWKVDANTLAPAGQDGTADGSAGSAAEGSLELAGTFGTAVFRVEQRSTARAGSTTAPPVLRQAYTVSVDEDLGTAPQAYGNASHVLSDLFLGADAAGPGRRDGAPSVAAADDEPLVRLDHGASLTSPFARPFGSPPPPKLQPGRGEYLGADPSISFPTEAAIGRYYRVTVPVRVGDQPATLAGWIDFGHAGRFEAAQRVQTEVRPGADTATLEWTVPSGAASGETWARLRLGRDTSQLVSSGGFADSGQVTDQRIKLTVGAARPEIAEPVDGTVLSEARPEISGEGAVAGATIEVREGDTALCKAKVGRDGDWSCRPAAALAAGPHGLTPVETTSGGVVLRGEAVKVTVKTAPPTAPALTLPAYTNDPGLQLTGTGDAGSTVSVTERSTGGELCSTAVRTDGQWSCLPVENLTEGTHQLTPVAVDAAGNRTAGQQAALVVDTVPPDRPVLGSPASGETLRVSRPKLAGRAEPGTNVLVTAGSSAISDQRTVLCGAPAALDGSWTCTANRDLTAGDQWLTVTATDLAGNGTSADPVRVRVAAAVAVPSPVTPSPVTPSSVTPSSVTPGPVASASAVPSPVASSPTVPGPSASVSAVPSAAVSSPVVPSPGVSSPATPSPSASASASVAASVAASASASAVPSPSPSPSVVAVPEVPVATPPAVLPIVVPPVVAPTAVPSPVAPSPAAASAGSATPTASASSPGPSPSVVAVPEVSAPVPPAVLPIVVPPVAPGPVVVASGSAEPGPVPSGSALPSTPASASPTSTATSTPTSTPSPTPSPGPTSAVSPSRAAVAAPTGGPSSAEPVGSVEAVEAEPVKGTARPLPVPPSAEGTQGVAGRSEDSGWRGGLAGILLMLTGIGLITRRVFARGPGARRR